MIITLHKRIVYKSCASTSQFQAGMHKHTGFDTVKTQIGWSTPQTSYLKFTATAAVKKL